MVLGIPKVWDILRRFKKSCQAKGWKTSESEDWVEKGGRYHNFLWTQTINLSTFKKIAANHRCAIDEGVSYRVVDVSYAAWLFLHSPTEELIHVVIEDPELLQRNAIYDLSGVYIGKPICLKFNKTRSVVFAEFERFLEKSWGVEVKPCQHALLEEV